VRVLAQTGRAVAGRQLAILRRQLALARGERAMLGGDRAVLGRSPALECRTGDDFATAAWTCVVVDSGAPAGELVVRLRLAVSLHGGAIAFLSGEVAPAPSELALERGPAGARRVVAARPRQCVGAHQA
jgi:hypothetical protein